MHFKETNIRIMLDIIQRQLHCISRPFASNYLCMIYISQKIDKQRQPIMRLPVLPYRTQGGHDTLWRIGMGYVQYTCNL